jgi:hypothetical protein
MMFPKLPSLPQDKANHAIWGAILAFGVYVVASVLDIPFAAELGLVAAAGAAVAKEVSDKLANIKAAKLGQKPPHGVEFYDAVATAAGGLIIYLSSQLGNYIK